MTLRFQRRIRILPFLHLNLSKSGVSVTIGTEGMSRTYSLSGTRTTVGLPGTGISDTHYVRRQAALPTASSANGPSTWLGRVATWFRR